MKTAALMRGLFGVALAFAAVWLIAILYWRSSGATPTTVQIIGYLLVVPVLLIGMVFLFRMLIGRRKARRTSAPSHDAAGAETPDSDPGLAQPDHVLYIRAAAARTRAGSSGEALAQALVHPQRPSLHPTLRDHMGLPVFAAAVEDLDIEPVRAAVAGVLPESRSRSQAFGDEQLRTLALLESVADDLLCVALPPLTETADTRDSDRNATSLHPHAMQHSRSSRATAQTPSPPVLHIRLLLPADWPEPVRRASGDWLADKAAATHFADGRVRMEVEPVTGAADAWRVLDRIARAEGSEKPERSTDIHLLLAAHSLVHEDGVNRLDGAGALLVSGNPEGLIPGEGAAGLLLAAAPPSSGPGMPAVRLHRVVHAPAGKGRGAARALAVLMQHTLNVADPLLAPIGAVFSDADHRPSRAIEIAGAITACLPDLDPVEQARHLGLACGETGAVATLAVLAAAAAQTDADGAPVLVASVADSELRFAALVSPVPNSELSAAAAAQNA